MVELPKLNSTQDLSVPSQADSDLLEQCAQYLDQTAQELMVQGYNAGVSHVEGALIAMLLTYVLEMGLWIITDFFVPQEKWEDATRFRKERVGTAADTARFFILIFLLTRSYIPV